MGSSQGGLSKLKLTSIITSLYAVQWLHRIIKVLDRFSVRYLVGKLQKCFILWIAKVSFLPMSWSIKVSYQVYHPRKASLICRLCSSCVLKDATVSLAAFFARSASSCTRSFSP